MPLSSPAGSWLSESGHDLHLHPRHLHPGDGRRPGLGLPEAWGRVVTPIIAALSTVGVALVLLVEILTSGTGRHRK